MYDARRPLRTKKIPPPSEFHSAQGMTQKKEADPNPAQPCPRRAHPCTMQKAGIARRLLSHQRALQGVALKLLGFFKRGFQQ
ncbi:MAG: hypothetical protein H0U54_09730 [Acidobacteria bacterium]|nr:hypothetical protein [Acidobacteriota bacterium]